MAKGPFEAEALPGDQDQRARKIKAAMAWLTQELHAGPQPAGVMLQRGQAAGHAPRTLQVAKERLHIKSQRVYGSGSLDYWRWELPAKRSRAN